MSSAIGRVSALLIFVFMSLLLVGYFPWYSYLVGEMSEALRPHHQQAYEPQSDNLSEGVVIIGGGIIGLSTAYKLALALKDRSKPRHEVKVTVVESSDHICPAASGQATGGLGGFGFGPETAPLGVLSYKLHTKMAAKYNGLQNYGFSKQTVHRVTPKDFKGTPSPGDDWGPEPPESEPLDSLPSWVRASNEWSAQKLASAPHGAHLDPRRFCTFLTQKVQELGVELALSSNVTLVQPDLTSQGFSSVKIQKREGSSRFIPCRALVIAAGPWSDRVFSHLFPTAKIKLPMNSTASAGNHFRVRTPGWKPGDDEEKSSEQVFFSSVLPNGAKLDITSFLDGELYIGGWGAIPQEIPDLATSIGPQESEIQAMIEATKKLLQVDPDTDLEIFEAGRCYRPLAKPNHPIITKVDYELLSDDYGSALSHFDTEKRSCVVGGLFLNTAHYSDGMTLSLGSGMVASELILGKEPSVDISGLGLPTSSKL